MACRVCIEMEMDDAVRLQPCFGSVKGKGEVEAHGMAGVAMRHSQIAYNGGRVGGDNGAPSLLFPIATTISPTLRADAIESWSAHFQGSIFGRYLL